MTMKNSRLLNAVLAYLLVFSAVVALALLICRPAFHGLTGYYYDNATWSSPPYATGRDAEFSTDTLKAIRAKLPQNIYSVEWKGYIVIPKTGVYSFSTESDDGSLLHVGETMVVENGGAHGLQERQGEIRLLKGAHPFRIRFEQHGGFAALNVRWARAPLSRQPLDAAALLPEETSLVRFSLYQFARAALSILLSIWGVLAVFIGVSTVRDLRAARLEMFDRHARPAFSLPAFAGQMLHRLLIEPARFAAWRVRRPEVFSWVIVVIYSSIIFLTLSYARDFSNFMMTRFGADIFSRITVVTLLLSGVALLIFLLRVKTQQTSRLLAFCAIAAMYAFFLSEPLRANMYAGLRWLGLNTGFWESLEIFPIYAGEKIHFLEYGVLGLLLCKALGYRINNRSAYWLALVIVYLIGMTDEGIQWWLPSRVGEYRDIWMNIASGALAILSVVLVIRPRAFRGEFHWSSLRLLCYALAVAALYTALFLQLVHGFGHKIFMPDSGAQFVSSFTEYQLLTLDKQIIQRYESKPAEDIPGGMLEQYEYEANRHHYLRNKYNDAKKFFESYCEQEIVKTYYRSLLRRGKVQLFEYDQNDFAVAPDVNASIFYDSPGHELAILAFSARAMWTTAGLIAVALCLLATFLPVSVKTFAQFRAPQGSRDAHRRFERMLLRPAFLAALFAIAAAHFYLAARATTRHYTNLLLLTVDSSQPDYWSGYGYDKLTTPFTDTLAANGVVFTNAIAPCSWTIPSLASLMTGVNPNVHGIETRGELMDPRVPTLFEALEQRGYAIGDTSYVMTEPSINSVFKKKDVSPEVALSEGRSEESYLLSWLEEHKNQPFFAWVHFHTAHLPYNATPPYNRLFLEDIDPEVLNDPQIDIVRKNLIVRKGEVEFDQARHAKAVRALYAQTLRQEDAKIGKVLMKLDELGLRENTLIVVTADHGDELLEHGFVGHASTSWDAGVYDDLLHVPQIYSLPNILPHKRIDAQVRTIDVMPTVLDMLHIPFDKPMQGKSLLPLINGTGEFDETAFAETTPCGYSCPKRMENDRRRAVRTNDWKFISIYNDETKQTTEELYDLKADPGETKNALAENAAIAELFRGEMRRWLDEPKQFAYKQEKTGETHYLDMDVEVRPIVMFPKVGAVVTPKTHEKRILVKWVGDAAAKYLIEYDVGEGGYRMTGEIEVVGAEQWFGPFPEDIWQALPLYNPWRFRVVPKDYPQFPSEWMTFEMKNE